MRIQYQCEYCNTHFSKRSECKTHESKECPKRPIVKRVVSKKVDSKRTLVQQNWREMSSWSGPSNDGASFHNSFTEVGMYIRDYTKDRDPRNVPEDYDIPEDAPFEIEVSEEVYAQIEEHGRKSTYGIRVGEGRLKELGLSVRPR